MPGSTLLTDFGYGRGDEPIPPEGVRPSRREVEVAVADAECRESSGLSLARYRAEVTAQLAAIEADEGALERLRVVIDEHQREVEAVIDDLASIHSRETG